MAKSIKWIGVTKVKESAYKFEMLKPEQFADEVGIAYMMKSEVEDCETYWIIKLYSNGQFSGYLQAFEY